MQRFEADWLESEPGEGRTPRRARNMVARTDGKLVNVARQLGQLFICAHGCCCGDTERGFAPGHHELYHAEWERRRLRNKVHLNMGGCLGPCPLANVVMLLFDGRTTFFHSMNTEQQVFALYDYIEDQVSAGRYLPPPATLSAYTFHAFDWELETGAGHEHRRRAEVAPPLKQRGFVFLTQADTDLLAIRRAFAETETDFPSVRAHHLGHLVSEEDAAAFFDTVVPEAEVVFLRLLGGRGSLPGFDYLVRLVERLDQWLIAVPATEDLDPELTAYSNVGVPVAHEARAYLQLGGLENVRQCFAFLSDHLLATGFGYDPPREQPRDGIYHPALPEQTLEAWLERADPGSPTVAVIFYRAHLLSGNIAFVDAFIEAGEAAGANVLPVYAYSLKDPAGDGGGPAAFRYLEDGERSRVDVVINTMSFAMGGAFEAAAAPADGQWSVGELERLGVPQIQAITASIDGGRWAASEGGLPPLDVAMNIAIPELDGRIISVPVSFKEPVEERTPAAGAIGQSAPTLHYRARPDRVRRVVDLAVRLAALRRLSNAEKRVVVILTNHNAKASRIANAVGLDSPASLLRLLEQMREAGYTVGELPAGPDELMHELIDHGNYDLDLPSAQSERVSRLAGRRYGRWFAAVPDRRREEMRRQWGDPPGAAYVDDSGNLRLAGLEFGNVFVAVQPPRGYGMDPTGIMHRPDLAPPHPYLALYRWLAEPVADGGWGAHALVHMGKHGSLEWLPGKGAGLSEECYPDLLLAGLPLVYPFIVDDPGEGAAAKRRAHAVIVSHLPPPLTTADRYGELEQLDRLVDEYYLLERTDPAKLPVLQQEIWEVIQQARLDVDLATLLNADGAEDHTHEWDPTIHEDGVPYTISDLSGSDFRHLVEAVHAYTHELSGTHIRDGLHTLGEPPDGERLVDSLLTLVRLPNADVPSLRAAVAALLDLDLGMLLEEPGRTFAPSRELQKLAGERALNARADALQVIDTLQRALLSRLAEESFHGEASYDAINAVFSDAGSTEARAEIAHVLAFICETLFPALRRTPEEIAHILRALRGGYVPPGPSGAPTRGMAHILPSGRNFYSVDPRALPSPTAWRVGEQLAAALVERYWREDGRFPEQIGISIWGTSAMRTQGDDVAQVLALMGVRPRWHRESRRVAGIESIPLEELGRPRIDVVCRISGFFRDAFPHLIALLDEAVDLVSALEEPDDRNFVRRNRRQSARALEERGVESEVAWQRAGYRVFGSPPGSYGAGILPLIDERQWRDDADFAEAYVNWGGYAYTRETFGVDARADFRRALAAVEIAVKNQDNREHDIFDSDDYLQFHGGMIAAIRSLGGRSPRRYFGDTQDPERPRVRDLQEEALRVFRSRVVNPKWLRSIQRHGYKGALEIAATVDYLFGYDATAHVVHDWMYERVAESYLFDAELAEFFRESNPWARHDIAERLLEAIQRGMWSAPGPEMRERLEEVYLEGEADLEGRAP